MRSDDSIRFSEEQRVRQVWIWGVVCVLAVLAWYAFVQQIVLGKPFGDHPMSDAATWVVFIAVGIALPILLRICTLVTIVDEHGIHIRFTLWPSRTITFDELKHCEPCRYRPMTEYWGWGIRWSPSRGRAYSLSGHLGVRCELVTGRRILIGTQRPDELVAAIRSGK